MITDAILHNDCWLVYMFTVQIFTEEEVKSQSFVSKMVYIIIGTTLTRQKYYFAWTLGL